jgi:hypothetical protein
MKKKIHLTESFLTVVNFGTYNLDTDKFPELSGKSNAEIGEWLMANTDKFTIESYSDHPDRIRVGMNADDQTFADFSGDLEPAHERVCDSERKFLVEETTESEYGPLDELDEAD